MGHSTLSMNMLSVGITLRFFVGFICETKDRYFRNDEAEATSHNEMGGTAISPTVN